MLIDPERTSSRIAEWLRRTAVETLRKKGVVVGVSGGVDSSVVLALAARALGPERVAAIAMPERESAPESLELAHELCDAFDVGLTVEDITGTLEAAGAYRRRDEAIRALIPEYGDGWRSKLTLMPNGGYQITMIVAQAPDGRRIEARPTAAAYRGIIAASNFKQRSRKMVEYYYADQLGYGVAGTPNRLEYELGFFVKGGDGQADLKPIAHLYKTQVYQIAEHLGVPESIRKRPPTTDTFSLSQSQEEFYFALPYDQMDLCLYALREGWSPEKTSLVVDLPPDRVTAVFRDIQRKRVVTRPLHFPPLMVGPGA